jgi:type II secretory pathway pseudopilin PulG
MSQGKVSIVSRIRRSAGALELLIVLLLLGVVVTLLAPRVARASHASQDATLADCLRYLRTQIQVYAIEHHNVAPGFADGNVSQSPDYPTFIAQLTHCTDGHGHVLAEQPPAGSFGPYLATIPANPLTLRTGVLMVSTGIMPPADESQPYGWFYCPRTRQIMPNVSGADSMGVAYSSY